MTKWADAKWEINRIFAARRGDSHEDILNAVCSAFEASGQRLTEEWRETLSDMARTASHGGRATLH